MAALFNTDDNALINHELTGKFPDAKGFKAYVTALKRARLLRDVRNANDLDCRVNIYKRADGRYLVIAHRFNPSQNSCWFWHVAMNHGACVSN